MATGRALGGAVIGAMVGVPLGLVLALLGHYTLVPADLASSELPFFVMWAVFALPFILIGGRHAAAPSPRSTRLVRAATGFGIGFLAGMATTLVLALAAAAVFGISQSEGAYAMGVAFVMVPLGGLVGGVVGLVWRLRRR